MPRVGSLQGQPNGQVLCCKGGLRPLPLPPTLASARGARWHAICKCGGVECTGKGVEELANWEA
eukprot:1142899-Pelagomonas_calceolata.AAC.2